MRQRSVLIILIVIMVLAFAGLSFVSIYSNAQLEKLNEARDMTLGLHEDWNQIESLTASLLITNKLPQTRSDWIDAREDFDLSLREFLDASVTNELTLQNVDFEEQVILVEGLWNSTKKRLDEAGQRLNQYMTENASSPLPGSILVTFGEQRATRRYSVLHRQLIDDLKWGASLSDTTFHEVLDRLVEPMTTSIRLQSERVRNNSLILSILILLAVGAFVVFHSLELARSRELIRAHADELTLEVEERKKAEGTLAEERNLLRTLIDNLQDHIYVKDLEGRFILSNEPMAHQNKFSSAAEMIGKTDFDIHGEESAQRFKENERRILESGEPQINKERHSKDSQGQERWFLNTKMPFRDADGNIAGLVGIGHDVTELKNAEEESRVFSEKLTALHEVGNELSRETTFDALCRKAVELALYRLGFDRVGVWLLDEKEGKLRGSFGTDIEGNVRDERSETMEFREDSLQVSVFEQKLRYATKEVKELEFSKDYIECARTIAAMWDGEAVIGYVSMDNLINKRPLTKSDNELLALFAATLARLCSRLRDEEKRKELETQIRQAQKMESLGVLAGGIAHDFNNLLMGILGNADLAMTDQTLSESTRGMLKDIETAARRSAELSRQMLAYSGRGRFMIEAADLNGIISEMAKLIDSSVPKKVRIEKNLSDKPCSIEADVTQVRQVVMNLIINGAEAIGEEGGMVEIVTGHVKATREFFATSYIDDNLPAGEYVYMDVIDNGSGMDEEVLKRVFDPFFTTKFTGRGLGLAGVLGIVRGHAGALKVTSKLGEGTSFRVLFPRYGGSISVPKKDKAVVEDFVGSGTVLVVDDEDTVRRVTQRMLEKIGYKVLLANDGIEALEVYNKHNNDIKCVLLDLSMPRMDGEETLKELRKIDENVCVLLSSGYSEEEISQTFAGKGAAAFVQKPYRTSELKKKLRSILSAR